MVRIVAAAAALCAFVAADSTPAPTPSISNPAWKMTAITSVQARVQADPPTWDATNQKFGLVLKQNTNTFAERYRAAMDTVNTASPEGALFYVQTEGINKAYDVACSRKTNMSYIWFMNITIVQPVFALAETQADISVIPEFGHFVAMDNGMCTPLDAAGTLSEYCLEFTGLQYTANLGPYVGGEKRETHQFANYTDNYWYSFPNNCFTKSFAAKNDACRAAQPGGLCPLGVKPDGVNCTFSYDVLGYLFIDDLVGITNLTNSQTGQPYKNRVEFCKDSKVEYDFDKKYSDLTFWNDPLNATANANRTSYMFEFYNNLLASGTGQYKYMKPLPSSKELTAANPPCYVNSNLCAKAKFGCRRKLMAQVCEVCDSAASDCVVMPSGATNGAPTLNKQYVPIKPTDANGKPVPLSPSSGGTSSSSASSIAIASSALLGLVAIML
uniref:Secreted protein n=1 Tax=Thraustotheca clavata TaxID=74557 RepID=A0A0A7CM77_9STRA|nr:secreted protein [Thraustotheca clavata]